MARSPAWDSSWNPSPPHYPREAPGIGRVGAGGPLWPQCRSQQDCRGRGQGVSSCSRKGQVGTDFGAKYEPCTGPGSGGSRVRPSLTVAPVEGGAGADAQ